MFRSNLKLLCSTHRRTYSTHREAWLYIDSVFPIQIARWDLRHFIGILRQKHLFTALQSRFDRLSSVHNFHPIEFQPQRKDGGVFVRFSYTPSDTPEDEQLSKIENSLREELAKYGSLPSWLGLSRGTIWLVKGSPWKEDMNRFASQILKITFEGPDVPEQLLYELCRPYGRITDLTMPSTVPAGAPRSATVTYQRICSATIARNVIHGFDLSSPSSSTSSPVSTRLRTGYQRPIQVHVIRAWMSSHPKIMLPLLVFLLGIVTYTIFDPIRILMVEGKMLDWFNFRKFKIYHWLQANTLDVLRGSHFPNTAGPGATENGWKERKDAEATINAYLADLPTTITFVHGPQGSGKTAMLDTVLKQLDRKRLIIDCRELHNTTSDSQLVSALATQTGYWPIFTFLNSMGGLIDLASVGLIGQKAGISSSLPEQLDQILTVVTFALKGVSSYQSETQRQMKYQDYLEEQRIQEAHKRQAIIHGTWHDGRLDCVAGNGIMSELGVGDERFEIINFSNTISPEEEEAMIVENEKAFRKQKAQDSLDITDSLPIVVIRNYAANFRSPTKETLLEALAQWAATLIENRIAHVVVLSDNRENAKRLAKALPAKLINFIPLSDADPESALSFVTQKLLDSGIDARISTRQTAYVERLGGRASDLESLVHKIRNGMSVEEAVEDIIARSVIELRKNAFGDDVDDAKGIAWTREQAWKVIKILSQSQEVPYYDMLVEFPFKGDERALRNMEHAELIAISTKNGRPSTIRAGKPIFHWVFEKLVNDSIFRATQELGYNEKEIAQVENKIKEYEQELALLVDTISKEGLILSRSACTERAGYIGEKMVNAERKVERLEKKNKELKKVLGKGDD